MKKTLHLSIRMYYLKKWIALICFKERQAGLKKSVRTLLNLSVRKGEEILYLHSFALCLRFIFEIVSLLCLPGTCLPFTHTEKAAARQSWTPVQPAFGGAYQMHQVALSQHLLDLQDMPIPQPWCFSQMCVPWATRPGCQSYYWPTCATILTIPNILGPIQQS